MPQSGDPNASSSANSAGGHMAAFGRSQWLLFVCLKRRIMAIKVNILEQLDNFSLKVDIDQKTNKKNLEDSADASPFVIVT